jgi:hypothetical protein
VASRINDNSRNLAEIRLLLKQEQQALMPKHAPQLGGNG